VGCVVGPAADVRGLRTQWMASLGVWVEMVWMGQVGCVVGKGEKETSGVVETQQAKTNKEKNSPTEGRMVCKNLGSSVQNGGGKNNQG
jgi:hypothetical protein